MLCICTAHVCISCADVQKVTVFYTCCVYCICDYGAYTRAHPKRIKIETQGIYTQYLTVHQIKQSGTRKCNIGKINLCGIFPNLFLIKTYILTALNPMVLEL